jgi:hypothetical protein
MFTETMIIAAVVAFGLIVGGKAIITGIRISRRHRTIQRLIRALHQSHQQSMSRPHFGRLSERMPQPPPGSVGPRHYPTVTKSNFAANF